MLTPRQCRPPYYGVTAVALYFPASLALLTHSSSADSTSLLVISDADQAYPVIVKNITSSEEKHVLTPLVGKDNAYKFKNCCAAYAPSFSAALIITRAGTVKLINCSTEYKSWEIAELGEGIDVGDKFWQYCGLGFSRDGSRAIAVDRRGKMIMADIS